MSGILYLVPTPIGNLDDITLRATIVLKQVDLIVAEDTRHTGRLLKHFDISKPTISYHEHNEEQRIPGLIQQLLSGQSIAVVSDAGTPALSDPGYKLIRQAIHQNIKVESLPGASAILVALAGSGLPTDHFYFGGFLPRTSGKRQNALASIKDLPATLIFFESPFRLSKFIADALSVLGNRKVVIARELTKIHQEFKRLTLAEAVDVYKNKTIKGEIVVVIDRNEL